MISGGMNAGVPVVTDNGTIVEMNVPGPMPAETTVTLPTLKLELQATGASGSDIDLVTTGASYANWDYAFVVDLVGIGLIANLCFVDPTPILATTPIN